MSNASAELRQAWLEHPQKKVDLIVRIKGDLDQRSASLAEHGAQIKYRFRLTGSVAVRCSGRVALALLDQPWVVRVEPDRAVPLRALADRTSPQR